jgi:hypothetical protein
MEKNPFLLDIEDKEEYTNEELEEIQQKLKEKDKEIEILLKEIHETNSQMEWKELSHRCQKGTKAILVYPFKKLYKIGEGGDTCVVCCTGLNDSRYENSKNIHISLEESGYNGHFYVLNGGFPNPTGTEMKYCGVPYSFKIFMILEAKKLGFEKVIWIDSACYVLKNLQPLFDILENNHLVCRTFPYNFFRSFDELIPHQTIDLFNQLANQDIRYNVKINSIIFGLNLKNELINEFIKEYYEMVKRGLPFISLFPEEMVFVNIFNQPKYSSLLQHLNDSVYNYLYIHECCLNKEQAKQHGYFCLQRHH